MTSTIATDRTGPRAPTSFSEVALIRAAAGEPGAELELTDDGAVLRRSILPGGVRVITESVPGLRSAGLGMWFGVGSRDEAAGQEGSTHFLEHLLFKGTARRDARAIAELVNARLGRRPTADGPRPGGESTARRDERIEDAGGPARPGPEKTHDG